MATTSAPSQTKPVEDSIAKVNNEFAVGSDPEFQFRWERFESIVWAILIIFVLLSVAGVFGRGPAAKSRLQASDGSLQVEYERVQRFGAPSLVRITFPASSVQNGSLQLWVSESLIKALGAQRVIPQPAESKIDNQGILYTFPVTTGSGLVEFSTEPLSIGSSQIAFGVPGKANVQAKVFVLP
ncbi:MAG TPA: hypothetical protein VH351_13990 [Bryobacteraceae bacterium]|jgi:hypothetical protein|nr:hypothetical protein [Bryobacteraceae bacterium]